MRRTLAVLLLILLPATARGQVGVIAPPGVYQVRATGPVTIVYGPNSITFTWGEAPIPGPLPPGPIPPGPVPPPVPPPSPAPIPLPGLRVLMVYESAELSKLPPAQLAVIYDRGIREYLDATCPKGADSRTPEYRIWDQNVVGADSEHWKATLARPRQQLPWIVISNGTTGYEGPLPATSAETLTLLKKYEAK